MAFVIANYMMAMGFSLAPFYKYIVSPTIADFESLDDNPISTTNPDEPTTTAASKLPIDDRLMFLAWLSTDRDWRLGMSAYRDVKARVCASPHI